MTAYRPAAVIVIDVERTAQAYVVSRCDDDVVRVLDWLEQPRIDGDVLAALELLREALRDEREGA